MLKGEMVLPSLEEKLNSSPIFLSSSTDDDSRKRNSTVFLLTVFLSSVYTGMVVLLINMSPLVREWP